MKTWQFEAIVVAIVMALVAWKTGGNTEWVGAAAVTLGFMHGQVADRMAERQALLTKPDVECYRWSTFYWITKEAAWLAYFVMHRSYTALVGVILFMAYPIWRKILRQISSTPRRPVRFDEPHEFDTVGGITGFLCKCGSLRDESIHKQLLK